MYFQLTRPKFFGCAVALLLLLSPAIVVAYLAHSYIWIGIVPAGVILLALILSAFSQKPKTVTAEQFASQLERHLLGTEGKLDWEYVTSVRVADPRLERIRSGLAKFDDLVQEKDRDELRALIAKLRSGEFR